jgi:hypothetical protein
MNAVMTGTVRSSEPDRLCDVPGDVRSLRRHRRDVDHHEGVDLAGASNDPDRLRVLGAARGGDHVDGVLRGRFGGKRPSERHRGRLREARDRESARLGRVGALHGEAARVRDDPHPVPGRGGLVREDGGDVQHLFERVGPDHAVLPEERVQGRIRRDDRGGVGRGCPDPRGTPAALHRDDRLPRADPARQAREALRIAEGFEVEQDHLGSRVLRPETQDVVPRDVGLVANGDELGEPETESRRLIHHREADRSALGEEPHAPFDGDGRRERAVEADIRIGVHDAHAVRADQPHAGGATHLEQLALTLRPLAAGLREPCGDHDEPAHPLLGALTRDGEHVSGRNRDEGEVDLRRDVEDAREPGDPLNRVRARVDRIHDAVEPAFQEVQEEPSADRAGVARGADDGDHLRDQERPDRVRGGGDVSILEVAGCVFGERGRDRDLDRTGECTDPR